MRVENSLIPMKRYLIFQLISIFCLIFGTALSILAWHEFSRPTIVIEWTTSSEIDTAGYNIYRSEVNRNGDERVNPELIPASTDPLVGGEYEFEDQTVLPGEDYRYYLEEVETNGQINRHGPISVKATRGGGVEIVLAVILLLLSGIFFVSSRRSTVQT
jgi:hypothetical protein